jgi:hypothetical protein
VRYVMNSFKLIQSSSGDWRRRPVLMQRIFNPAPQTSPTPSPVNTVAIMLILPIPATAPQLPLLHPYRNSIGQERFRITMQSASLSGARVMVRV